MSTQEQYIKSFEQKMKKYTDKIAKIDSQLKSYKANNKAKLLSGREELKEKFKEGEAIYKKLKSSTKANFEEIKESAADTLDSLSDAFQEFSHLMTMDQLHYVKDEIAAYGTDKVIQAEDYIKRHPLEAAGWAFGLGFVVGLLLTRSK